MLRNACVLPTNDYLQISPRLVSMDRLANISTSESTFKMLSRIRCLHVEILISINIYILSLHFNSCSYDSVADANMNTIPFSSNAMSLHPYFLRYVTNYVHVKKHVKNENEKRRQ